MPESLKEHTDWRTFVSYWAWILTANVSIGGALRASNQYVAADLCFVVAGLAAVVKSIQVAVDATEDRVSHRVLYAVGYSILAVVMTGLVLWGVAPARPPESVGNGPPIEVPPPAGPRPELKQEPPPERVPEPESPLRAGSGGKRDDTPTPPPFVPPGPRPEPPAPIVVSTPGNQPVACQAIPPDRAPNITLRAGEVVFAAEGGLLRLDRDEKAQRILIAEELMNVRGVAVEQAGTILVSTTMCGAGAIVRVDPKTGQMSGVATGFKTPKAILLEPAGTLLVADEIGGSPWGYLWRVNLKTREAASIYSFSPSEVATGMGVDPKTGNIFFTRRGLFRMSNQGVTRLNVEGVLAPTSMAMRTDNLLVTAEGPPMMEIRTNGDTIRMIEGGGPISDLVARGKDAFVGYSNGRVGVIRDGSNSAQNVWEGKPSGIGVFVAIVPDGVAR